MTAAELARNVNCPVCWEHVGSPCTPLGEHLGRYQKAERRGFLSREDLAEAVARLDVIAEHVIVPAPAYGRAA